MNKQVDKIFAVINLGSSNITAMLASKQADGRIQPISYAKASSQGSIIHGYIHNVTELSRIVASLLDELSQGLQAHLGGQGAIIKRIYIGLDCQSMRSDTFKAELSFGEEGIVLEQEQLRLLSEQAKRKTYPARSVLHISEPRYYVDGHKESRPSGVRCRRLEAYYQLISIRQEIKANIIEVFEKRLQLSIEGILVSPIAEASVSLNREDMMLGAAYINIGGGTTSIAIYKERVLCAFCVLPLGGINVTRDLTNLKLLEADAEQVKRQYGSMDREVDKTLTITAKHIDGTGERSLSHYDVNSLIYARMNELTANILALIKELIPEGGIGTLVLSGGAIKQKGYRDYLDELGLGDAVRFATARYDLVVGQESPEFLINYQASLGLLQQAKVDCIDYPVEELDALFDEEEESPSTNTPEPKTMPTIPSNNGDENGELLFEGDIEDFEDDDFEDYEDSLDQGQDEDKQGLGTKVKGFFRSIGDALNKALGNDEEELSH